MRLSGSGHLVDANGRRIVFGGPSDPPAVIIRPSTMAWDGFMDMPPGDRALWETKAPAPPARPSWWRRALAWCWAIVRRYLGRPAL